jgi:predicted permease
MIPLDDDPGPAWRRYLRFWRSNVRADVEDEFQFHLQERIDDLVALGMTPEQARADAVRRFGDIDQVKDTCRALAHLQETDMRRSETLDVMRQDLVYAVRTMRSNVAFTAAVVLTLALGIGATTAIFSVVNAVVLRPLPYADPGRMVMIFETFGDGRGGASVGHYHDWMEQSRSFSAVAAYQTRTFTLTDGEPTRVVGALVTPSFFTTGYMRPYLGRYFLPSETGASRVTVLSYPFWQSRYAGDPQIVGKEITLNGEKHVVVGVTPAAYTLTTLDEKLWVPLTFTPEQRSNYGAHYLQIFAKLTPTATLEQANRDIARVTDDIRRRQPDAMKNRGATVVPFNDVLTGDFAKQLFVLLGAVTFVLLIGCGNVASLLLARATTRRKEIAIRGALGGARGRLIRQLVTESLVLSLIGGAAGLLVAALGIRFLKATGPAFVPRLGEAGLQVEVLLFAIAATVGCGLLFGLAPALRATRVDLQSELREGGRGSRAVTSDRTRAALIMTEIAVSLVLLVSAGLFLRSAQQLQRVPLGFEPEGVTMMRVSLSPDRYKEGATVDQAFKRIVDEVRGIPGVQSAAAGSRVPMWGGSIDIGVRVDGRPRAEQPQVGHVRVVTAGYFETLGMRLLRGRGLLESDVSATAPWVIVVNETFAKSIFGTENPLGHRISGWASDSNPQWREIVGVVRDVRSFGRANDVPPEIYMPLTQEPDGSWNAFQRQMTVVARAQPGTVIGPALRRAVSAVDPLVPIYDLQTMDDVLSQSTSTRRFNTLLLSLIGVTGLILAAIGIYGVIAYFVSQRTHEIGVRVALGASAPSVVRMVVSQALWLALAGVAIGTVLAFWATRANAQLLYSTSARDPVAYGLAAAVLLLVAVGASWIPARRAARVEPIRALGSS